MALNRSKYSQPYDRVEEDEDEELNKMSFNNPRTAEQFERREIDQDAEEYQMSRKQRSYQNRRKMDRIRPDGVARGVRE